MSVDLSIKKRKMRKRHEVYTRRRYVYFHRITPVAVRELRTRSVEQREVRDLILQCMNQGSTVKLYRCHASNNRCFDGGGRRKEDEMIETVAYVVTWVPEGNNFFLSGRGEIFLEKYLLRNSFKFISRI